MAEAPLPFRLGDPGVCLNHPSPSHPVVVLCTRGLYVSVYCIAVFCVCVFLGFLYLCSVVSFSTLILLVGSFGM